MCPMSQQLLKYQFLKKGGASTSLMFLFSQQLCKYDTCYRTSFSWGIQWYHFFISHDYANMHNMQIFAKITYFLHISAHFTMEISLLTLGKVIIAYPHYVEFHITHFCYALCIKNMHKSAYLAIIASFLCISLLLTIQIAYFMVGDGTGVQLEHARVHITHFCYALCIKNIHKSAYLAIFAYFLCISLSLTIQIASYGR